MTTTWPIWALLMIVLTLAVVVPLLRRGATLDDRLKRAALPPELMDAQLIYVEQRFDVTEPARLSARLDRAYRMSSGELVLMELKTRRVSHPFPSDVIQLSAQKLALERQTGQVVAQHGYVVAQILDGAQEPHRVQLMSAKAVVALTMRREAILAGRVNPRPAASVKMCRTWPSA